MGNTSILKPIMLVFFLYLLCHISIATSTPPYIAVDNINLNCGFPGNSTDNYNRMWIGDMEASKYAPIEEHNQKSNTSEAQSQDPSVQNVPYRTARLSYSQFTYVFHVTSGPKFVRFYFYADSYSGYDGSQAFFSIEANSKFTLLRNFSASILATYLGDSRSLSKEFCINVEEDQILNLTFIPTPSTATSRFFAFVNGIEIVSMPTYLYYSSPENPSDTPPYVGQHSQFSIDNNRALEMSFRLNMGGNAISPTEDTGMFREWSPGSPYLLSKAFNPRQAGLTLKYSKIRNYTAPDNVYRSAITMGPNISWNLLSNLTWGLPVDPGFYYLVRLHFCEIEPSITMPGERPFVIYIDKKTAEASADVIMWSGGRDTPVYKDYVVMIQKMGVEDKRTLFINLHPGKATNAIYDAILNGVEVFKLSDNNNNLAGPNPAAPLLPSPLPPAQQLTSNSRKKKFIANIGTGVGLSIAFLTLACCVVVWKLRTSKHYGSYYPVSKCWSWSNRNKGKSTRTKASSLPEELCCQFPLEEIKKATHNFDEGLVNIK